MRNCNPIRGTYDYLPREARTREIVRQIILESYQNNGFNLISTPILENLDLLNMSDGGDNLKLMFKTIKRRDKLDLTKENLTEDDIVEEGLRYDLTVPLARFYAKNKEKLPTPFKSIQLDYAFRAERPQKGRNRQFVQCDIDILGDDSINAEIELLKTALNTYSRLGFNNLTLKINHREILNSIILYSGFVSSNIGTICVTLDKLDKIGIDGIMMELIEKGFETENINKLVEVINAIQVKGLDCLTEFNVNIEVVNKVKNLIDSLNKLTDNNFNINYDVSIVRGQGYYTGTVFECYTEGFGGAIGGGGRYDKMVEKIVDVPVSAVGMSIGFEPVCMLLLERNEMFDAKKNLALIYDENDDLIEAFEIKEKLQKDFNVSLYKRAKNMKNFYEKIGEVADLVTTMADYKNGKEFKVINNG